MAAGGVRSLGGVHNRHLPVGRFGIALEGVLVVALLAALGVTAFALADSWGGGYWVFDCVAGAVAGGLALIRRRHLVVVSTAVLVVALVAIVVARAAGLPREPGPAVVLALAVVIGSAVRRLPGRVAVGITAAGLAVVIGSQFGGHPSPAPLTVVTVLNALGWLAAVAAGSSLRLLDVTGRATEERTRRDERLELARELHDVAAHHLTGIVLQAQAARIVARKRPDELDGSLAGIEGAGSEALTAMRRVVGLLRDADDAASAKPGPEQLSDLVGRFDGTGVPIALRLPEQPQVWPPEVTSTIYRIVQEALTNVSRHAPHARGVSVTVEQGAESVRVEVADDGPPATSRYPRRGGYGLIGMRERVEALGGTLSAGPRPGAGWSVLATVPTGRVG